MLPVKSFKMGSISSAKLPIKLVRGGRGIAGFPNPYQGNISWKTFVPQ